MRTLPERIQLKNADQIALMRAAGLVVAEPGERRRIRYRLRSAPVQVAQQFLAALARDWDGPLEALTAHLDRSARDTEKEGGTSS